MKSTRAALLSLPLFVLLSVFQLSATAAPPTELVVQDLVVGTGDTIKRHAFAVMHFNAWVYDEQAPENKGVQFGDSRKRGESVTWVYGRQRAIAGVEKGMQGMRVGGKRLITIPPKLAYDNRKHPAPEEVPPNAALLFEVELLNVVPQDASRPSN